MYGGQDTGYANDESQKPRLAVRISGVFSVSARLTPLALCVMLGVVACAPLFGHAGFLLTRGAGDSANLLFRVQQLLAAYAGGDFPARWMPDGAYGYGLPYFTYYASFSTHVAAWFKLAGFSYALAIKLAQAAAIALGAWAVYGWIDSFGSAAAGRVQARPLAAAIAYTFAPFHLVNVYARGDSLAELWALALAPLALWAAERLGQRRSFGRVAALATTVALIVCTHNVSALMILPFIGVYALARTADSGPQTADDAIKGHASTADQPSSFALRRSSLVHRLTTVVHRVSPALAALAWGVALSAFFWLPALGETGAVQLSSLTNGYFSYTGHFRSADLLQSDWIFSYNQNPFAMGLTQTCVALAGLIAFLSRRERPGWREVFILVGLAATTFLITPWSEGLYAHVPGLAYVQFPWRFLGPQSLFLASLTGWLWPAEAALEPRIDGRSLSSTGFMLVLGGALAATALIGLRLEFVPLADEEVTAARLNLFEQATSMIGNTANAEYLPVAVVPRPWTSSRLLDQGPQPVTLAGTVSGELVSRGASRQTWSLAAANAATVALPTYWWPGWTAQVDGTSVPTHAAAGLGFIAFDLPTGSHTVTLALTDTPMRATANVASVMALLLPLVVYAARLRRARRSWQMPVGVRLVVILLLAVVIVPLPGTLWQAGTWNTGPGRWDVAPGSPADAAPLNIDSVVLAFPHRDVVRFADGSELTHVGVPSERPTPGSAITVRLDWRHAAAVTATVTLWPPSAPVMPEAAPILSAVGTTNAMTQTDYVVTLPEALSPGVYWWTVELTGPDGPIASVTAGGRARGRVFLSPFIIDAATPAPDDSLVELGPLRLHALSTSLRDGGVDLGALWSATQPIGQDLALSYRLIDPLGEPISQRDGQPGGGFLPTHDWVVGQAYPETVRLALGDDPAAGSYRLDVVAYRPATLEPVGSGSTAVLIIPSVERLERVARWELAAALALEGVEWPTTVEAGTPLVFSARWLTGAPAPTDRVRWSLLAADGQEAVGGEDLLPGRAGWPASAALRDVVSLYLPPDLPAGDYALQVRAGSGKAEIVGQVAITATTRSFELPPLQRTLGAAFADEIALAGYDYPARDELTLVFRALRTPGADYKYFVHVVDPGSGALVAQVDAEPSGDAHASGSWLPGEVVIERVALDLTGVASGAYDLYVGWYDPSRPGAPRLAAVLDGTRSSDDRIKLPDMLQVP